MIYIKVVSNNYVQLGGTVASQAMLDDGWIEYDGIIPEGTNFRLNNGILETYVPEIAPLTQVQNYKDYLAATDFKMLPGYVPKPDEDVSAIKKERNKAREYIRANDTTKANTNTEMKVV